MYTSYKDVLCLYLPEIKVVGVDNFVGRAGRAAKGKCAY